MSNLLYWVVPCTVVAIVGILIALRERRPHPPEESVDAFSRRMTAMSSMAKTRAAEQKIERDRAV